ncbi:hypothetical protein [Agromyces sp. PvR057]|uniref:hypothetical protein n=1 Tax=Agromyces sp. PvR057 TaxID=3156403 RepID=UPI003393B29D
MTDFRFPERWLLDRRFARLSADALAAYVTAGAWCVSNRTDGAMTRDDLSGIPRMTDALAAVLVAAALLAETPDGWHMLDFAETQTSRANLESAALAREADSQARKRRRWHKSGVHALCTPDTCEHIAPPGVTRDIPVPPVVRPDIRPDIRGDSTGQDRTGKDRQLLAPHTRTQARDARPHAREAGPAAAVLDWAVTTIPNALADFCRTHDEPWPCPRSGQARSGCEHVTTRAAS